MQSSPYLLDCTWLWPFSVSASSNGKGANEAFEALMFEKNVGNMPY
jgi:hypothetical protein